MKKKLILVFAISFFVMTILSCKGTAGKYEEEIQTCNLLVERIKKNDTMAIKQMIGIELDYIALDNDALISRINNINLVLKQLTLPSKKEYQFREYAKSDPNLVDIIIPLLSDKGKTTDTQLTVSFAKYLSKGKILNFKLIQPHLEVPSASPQK